MGATGVTREILSITDEGEWGTEKQRLWRVRYRVRGNHRGARPETYLTQDLVVAKDELGALIEVKRLWKFDDQLQLQRSQPSD